MFQRRRNMNMRLLKKLSILACAVPALYCDSSANNSMLFYHLKRASEAGVAPVTYLRAFRVEADNDLLAKIEGDLDESNGFDTLALMQKMGSLQERVGRDNLPHVKSAYEFATFLRWAQNYVSHIDTSDIESNRAEKYQQLYGFVNGDEGQELDDDRFSKYLKHLLVYAAPVHLMRKMHTIHDELASIDAKHYLDGGLSPQILDKSGLASIELYMKHLDSHCFGDDISTSLKYAVIVALSSRYIIRLYNKLIAKIQETNPSYKDPLKRTNVYNEDLIERLLSLLKSIPQYKEVSISVDSYVKESSSKRGQKPTLTELSAELERQLFPTTPPPTPRAATPTPQPVREPEPEPETVREPEPEPETVREPESEPETVREPEPEPEPETVRDPTPRVSTLRRRQAILFGELKSKLEEGISKAFSERAFTVDSAKNIPPLEALDVFVVREDWHKQLAEVIYYYNKIEEKEQKTEQIEKDALLFRGYLVKIITKNETISDSDELAFRLGVVKFTLGRTCPIVNQYITFKDDKLSSITPLVEYSQGLKWLAVRRRDLSRDPEKDSKQALVSYIYSNKTPVDDD